MTLFSALFALVVLVLVALPLVRSDYWTFRAMEYPRLQKWVLIIVASVFWSIFGVPDPIVFWAVMILLLSAFVFVSIQIYPYLPLAPREVQRTPSVATPEEGKRLSLLIANVWQPNRQTARLLEFIRRLSPDVVLLLETNQWWENQLEPIKKTYPYTQLVPQENTYGMLLYSKFRLEKQQIHYLVENDVPSIECNMVLSANDRIHFFGVHPRPPAPSESVTSTEKDRELLLVAEKAKADPGPVLVAGDLNDVAWSYTTNLFQKMSRLLDPRKGRGFYNTFPVKWPIMRFPLDHIFCSRHFQLIRLHRLKNIGSDHFPIFIEMQLLPAPKQPESAPVPDEKDKIIAVEKFHDN